MPVADQVEDEVGDFKRVQIVATTNSTKMDVFQAPEVSLTQPTDSAQAMMEGRLKSDEEDDPPEDGMSYLINGIKTTLRPRSEVGEGETSDGHVTVHLEPWGQAFASHEARSGQGIPPRRHSDTADSVANDGWDNRQVERIQWETQAAAAAYATTSTDNSTDEPLSLFAPSDTRSAGTPPPPRSQNKAFQDLGEISLVAELI